MTVRRRARWPLWIGFACAVLAGAAAGTRLRMADLRVEPGRIYSREQWAPWAREGLWIGSPDARVVIVEFGEMTCGACAVFAALADSLLTVFPDIAISYRHAVLRGDELNVAGASVLTCAGRAGRFHEAFAALYASPIRSARPEAIGKFAERVGLPWRDLLECVDAESTRNAVQRDRDLANALRVRGTPTLIINGIVVVGVPPRAILLDIIRDARRLGREHRS